MTCGLVDGIQLRFLKSGIVVRPLDLDLRAARRNYSHANIELKEEAGKLVARSREEAEPVIIEFDGVPSRRMYLPPDSISFTTDLDGFEKAELQLHDARKVMTRGNVSKTFESVTFAEVVDHIMSQVDDPHNVITDYGFVDEEDAKDSREAANFGDSLLFSEEQQVAAANKLGDFLNETLLNRPNPFNWYSGFEFDEITPLEAMQRVTKEFEENWWVDADGELWIGTDGTRGQVLGTVAGDNQIALKRYSVTTVENRTNSVQISVPTNKFSYNKENIFGLDFEVKENNLTLLVESKDPTINGSVYATTPEEDKMQQSPKAAERVATSLLVQKVMDDSSGSMAINGMASEDTDALAKLDIGDHILVDPSIETRCNKDVITGIFLVTSVQHRVNTRQGWHIEIKVAQIPNYNEIETRSVYYDPIADKKYEELDAYQSPVDL